MKLNHLLFVIAALAVSLSSHAFAVDSWDGKDYVSNSSSQQQDARSVINRIVEDYRSTNGMEPRTILDIGCGDGIHTQTLATIYPKATVVGVDPSSSMFAQAEKRMDHHLSFLQLGVEELGLSQQFDLIVSFHVLHWVVDQPTALAKIKEHLAIGGRAYLLLSPSKEGLPYQRALSHVMNSERWRERFVDFKNTQYHFSADQYRQLVSNAGLMVEEINYHLNRKSFGCRAELQNWVKQWSPHAKYLGEDGEDFLNDLFDHYFMEVPLDRDGRATWREYVLLVIASREA
jgi:trans-aconitate methyltransferase